MTTKPRIEVTQESQERLEVVELDRTTRDEKTARETAHLEGASEVAYRERAFRPRHAEDIDAIRAKVDALQVQRRPLPDVPAMPTLPLPPAPVAPPIPEDLRRALEPVVPGALASVERVYATERAEVVEAFFDADGQRRSREYIVQDGVARPVEDVEGRIDALPAPKAPPPAAPAPEPQAESPKRGRFAMPKLALPKRKPKEPEAEQPKEQPSDEKKRRFRLPGRK